MASLLNQVRDHVQKFTSSERTPLKDAFTLLGFGLISYKILSLAGSFAKNFLLPSKDLAARYGKGSWALITGGTEGSGRCYALSLAKKGFNLVLISRSQKKFEAVLPEITAANPEVKVIFIQADFANCHETGFWDPILEKIKDLDISILINNAAIKGGRYFLNYTDKELLNSYNANCLAPAMLVKKLCKKMLSRPQRSAIINVGSLSGVMPLPHYINYGTTKYFLNFFSEAIRKEFSHKIDVQYLAPGFFESATSRKDRKKSLFDCLPENVVKASLDQLGYQHWTAGHWRHKLYLSINLSMPKSWVIKRVLKDADSRIKSNEAELAKNNKTEEKIEKSESFEQIAKAEN